MVVLRIKYDMISDFCKENMKYVYVLETKDKKRDQNS